MGGKRQANILSSIIKNFQTVEDVIQTSANASGSALAENEKYLDSIQGKIDLFTNALQTFWMNFIDSSVINVGCTVKIKDLEFNEEMEYKIVGSTEANSLQGKISNESPVGKALIGAQKGDTVEVETPAGMIKYMILDFHKN